MSSNRLTNKVIDDLNWEGLDTQDLLDIANEPINKEGMTSGARALSKHASGQRVSGTFPKLSGGIPQQNASANEVFTDILSNENITIKQLSRGGLEIRDSSGRGIRYNKDGSLSGLLDP